MVRKRLGHQRRKWMWKGVDEKESKEKRLGQKKKGKLTLLFFYIDLILFSHYYLLNLVGLL